MPTTSRRVRVGFIGGGMMCQVGHLPFYLGNPNCEVVALVECRPSLVNALKSLRNAPTIISGHRELLEDFTIDAVVISAPRPATGPLTLDALTAGKHVLAEKPMAHTVEQAERLTAAAREQDLLYSIGHMKQFDPGVERAVGLFEDLRKSGRMGALLFARFFNYSRAYAMQPPTHTRPAESRKTRFDAWPLWPDWLAPRYRDTYAWFMNVACHDVNLVHLFLGERMTVVAAAQADGTVTAQLEADGTPVTLELTKTAAGRWLEGGEFLFETGRLGFAVPSPMDTASTTRVWLEEEDGSETTAETEQGWSFARQAEGFVAALNGSAKLRNAGAEGVADLKLAETIWKRIQG